MNLTPHRRLIALLFSLTAFAAFAQPQGAAPVKPLTPAEIKIVCQIIGNQLGETLLRDFTPAEIADVRKGLEEALAKKKPKYAFEQYRDQIQAFATFKMQQEQERQRKENEKREAEFKTKAAEQAQKAPAFLEKAAKEPSAQKTASGLVFIPVTEGSGESPLSTSQVKVHYRGTLMDGTVFDSSYERNAPATMPLGNTIQCWQEALPKMKVGGKAKVVCPASLAYGDNGALPNIPPHAPLQFEIELLEVVASSANMTPARP